MHSESQFSNVLDAVERLSDEDQETLLDIIRHRLAQRGRDRIARDVEEGRREFAAGRLKPMSVDEIMDEINS
jgi:hypothetical protein